MQMETLSRQLYRFMDDLIDTALCNLYGAQAHSSLFFFASIFDQAMKNGWLTDYMMWMRLLASRNETA